MVKISRRKVLNKGARQVKLQFVTRNVSLRSASLTTLHLLRNQNVINNTDENCGDLQMYV